MTHTGYAQELLVLDSLIAIEEVPIMKFNDLYASETRKFYEIAMTVYAIEKFFDPDTTDSELCALDLGDPKFVYDGTEVSGFATVVQTADPEEDESIYYHLLSEFSYCSKLLREKVSARL